MLTSFNLFTISSSIVPADQPIAEAVPNIAAAPKVVAELNSLLDRSGVVSLTSRWTSSALFAFQIIWHPHSIVRQWKLYAYQTLP